MSLVNFKFDGVNWTTLYNSKSLPYNYATKILHTKNGETWIGFISHGVAVFDGKSWSYYTPENSAIPDDHITELFEASNGDIWIGTHNGIVKFDGTNWTTYDFHKIFNHVSYVKINTIIETSNGDIWVASNPTDGVAVFDGTNWKAYTPENSGIPDVGNSLLTTSKGTIYIGTSSGITKFDGTNWTIYNTNNSNIIDNNIVPEFEDHQGNIWFRSYSQKSMIKFNGTNWTTYDLSNFRHSEVKTAIEAPNGDILVGTRGRVNSF